MKQQSFQINIPKPCNENWSTMTPKEKGRHCNACDHIVIDFASMNDFQVLNYFKNYKSEKRVCGHFNTKQLNKTIQSSMPTISPVYTTKNNMPRAAAVSIGVFLSSLFLNIDTYAQTKTPIPTEQKHPIHIKGKVAINPNHSLITPSQETNTIDSIPEVTEQVLGGMIEYIPVEPIEQGALMGAVYIQTVVEPLSPEEFIPLSNGSTWDKIKKAFQEWWKF